jgi:hypothetical protein
MKSAFLGMHSAPPMSAVTNYFVTIKPKPVRVLLGRAILNLGSSLKHSEPNVKQARCLRPLNRS